MKRLVFLDLDGTVVTQHQIVPDSAREALQKVHDNGRTLWICTGRSAPEIYPWLWDLGFQGFIGANGAHARLDGKDLFDHRLSKEFIEEAEAYFREHGIVSLWQTPDALHPAEGFMEMFFQSTPEAVERWSAYIDQVTPYVKKGLPEGSSKGMITIPPTSDLTIEDVNEHLGPQILIIPASVDTGVANTGEVMLSAYNKGTGLKEVAEVLGFPIEQTVAVGDELNDLQMVSTAGMGIAMGNAVPEVKKVADFVSTHIEEDGLANALKHAGLID